MYIIHTFLYRNGKKQTKIYSYKKVKNKIRCFPIKERSKIVSLGQYYTGRLRSDAKLLVKCQWHTFFESFLQSFLVSIALLYNIIGIYK